MLKNMKILEKIMKKIVLTEREKLLEALKTNPLCSPLNSDLRENELNNEDGQGMTKRIWLNPNNQKCFNFGWFTYQDFYDWIEGHGRIVKGNTPEEKQKFWEAAKFVAEHDYGWAIGYYKKYFDLIDDSYYPERKKEWGMNSRAAKPLKITKTNHEEIISKVFGDICRWYSDTELTYSSHLQTKIDSELMGAKQTLFILGVGYYGASNTPEEILNLSWIADICKYKSVYRYFEKNNIKMPDWDFVYKNKY